MAGSMIIRGQRTEDRGQRVGAATPLLIARVSIFCLLSSVLCPLNAEDLPDPTRPPASIFVPAAGIGAGGDREATVNQSSGLHLVIISKTRRAAIIDGQTVELGEEHGNARLIEVNEGGVVLQRAQSRQVLTLFPGVKITRKETTEKESARPGNQLAEPGKESAEKE
jgi:MSHA biogenesis protein MshK